jgi:nucleoporin POM34
MMSSSTKVLASTPKPGRSKPLPIPDSPGTWRHPRLDEIARRQTAATFTNKNVNTLIFNGTVLLGLWTGKVIFQWAYGAVASLLP